MAAKKKSALTAVKSAVAKAKGRKTSSSSTSSSGGSDSTSKKTSAKRAAPTKKTAAKKAAPVKKATAKKAAPVKKAAKKTPAKQTPAKKTAAKKAPAKKTAAKKTTAKKAPAKKSAAKKSVGPKKTAAKKTGSKKTVTSHAAPAKQPVAKKAPAKKAAAKGRRGALAVRDGERPWTPGQIAEVRATLESDRARLTAEIVAAEEEIGHLLREGGEGAGNDQADVGSNTFERDHEMTMAKNARESLVHVQTALARIDDGTYGVCESCGKPIGKMRLQAFPRATLCMECKQRQERR